MERTKTASRWPRPVRSWGIRTRPPISAAGPTTACRSADSTSRARRSRFWPGSKRIHSGNDSFVSKATSTSTANTYWSLGINGNNRIRARVKIGGTTRQVNATVSTMSAGVWYFAAVTFNGTTMRVYLNGVEVGNGSWSGAVSTNAAVAVGLGNQPSGAGNRAFDGTLDELTVLNTALGAAQIQDLYAIGGNDLIGHWKLNQSSGTTATDSSTFAANGTVTGGASWSTRCSGVGVFDFNGSSQYISVPSSAHLQPTSSVSIAGWVRGDAWGSGTEVDVILRKGDGNPNNYQLAIADGRATLFLDDSDGGGFRGNTVLETGKWYHVAATWNGSTVKIYRQWPARQYAGQPQWHDRHRHSAVVHRRPDR